MNTQAFNDFLHQNDVTTTDSSSNTPQTNDFSVSSSVLHSGFIAQDVYQAEINSGYITDIVHTPNDANDNYSIAYGVIVVPLVQAVQELSKIVDSLQTEISALQPSGSHLRTNNPNDTMALNENLQYVILTSKKAILYQNDPNPTSQQTSIRYYLSDETSHAEMVFFDMYGKEIKRVLLENRGNAKLEVNTKDLDAGIYTYSLIVDGNVVETLRMVRTR